ncbi:hypothetical protein B0J15DRAFT_472860 [Fusarium solani]|uniref:Uncharacterized protein n=1 Tax=Fusarium solani TaxID=169388 RepID=A0A9P9G1P9_FUSSL|nr:uncharacterized protein B0J15DRAFT_472860 [Fusarium solani]KAH7230856.1 hypothetical protein B0J15DRAFT_472860 [Fusarium solani]
MPTSTAYGAWVFQELSISQIQSKKTTIFLSFAFPNTCTRPARAPLPISQLSSQKPPPSLSLLANADGRACASKRAKCNCRRAEAKLHLALTQAPNEASGHLANVLQAHAELEQQAILRGLILQKPTLA